MLQTFTVTSTDASLKDALRLAINQKTKPLGALGYLEQLALQIGLIQNSLTPSLQKPSLLIFAADHGIANAGVSAYLPEVTAQMVHNFLSGGAAISVFTRQHNLALWVVDAGVNADLAAHPQLIDRKIAKGSANFLEMPALTAVQCQQAITAGADCVVQRHAEGCNCIGFGEMGIGNTSSAALLMHGLTGLTLEHCIGRGTGLNDTQLVHKRTVLQQALAQHPKCQTPLEWLQTFGGLEIAMLVGAYLKAAELNMVILVDGFIAGSTLLVAQAWYPTLLDYCLFSHVSDEQGHRALLSYLKAKPLLDLQLRLGEGSGVALAYPLVQSAVLFLTEMASFAEAGVTDKA